MSFGLFVGVFVVMFYIIVIAFYWICVNKSIKCSAICFLTFCIVIFTLLLNFSWYDDPESAPTFIIEKNLLKNLKKQEEYKEHLEKLSILNNSEIKKELYRNLKNLISPELQQWISVNNLLLPYSKIEKDNNDELNDKTEKWNPAQELLISYIKECELTVFEAEKVQDFIRNEIKAKR